MLSPGRFDKALELLAERSRRNQLAHGQDILSYDWKTILDLTRKLDRLISRI